MTLYRRGTTYLVVFDAGRAFTYDASTGLASRDIDPLTLGPLLREYRPVHDDDPIPDGLRARLILKTPGASD